MQFPSAGQAKRGGTSPNAGQNVFFTDRQDLESFGDASHSVRPSTQRSGTNDAEGYGFTDYSAPVTVRPGLSSNSDQPRFKCVLNGHSLRTIGSITDGTSNTVAIAEDAERYDVDTGGRSDEKPRHQYQCSP